MIRAFGHAESAETSMLHLLHRKPESRTMALKLDKVLYGAIMKEGGVRKRAIIVMAAEELPLTASSSTPGRATMGV